MLRYFFKFQFFFTTSVLRPLQRLRSIVMSMSVCSLSVSSRGHLRNHTRDLYHFLCTLPMSVARSSSGMFTIGRIARRRKGVFFPLKMHYRPGRWDGSAQRGWSMLSTIAFAEQYTVNWKKLACYQPLFGTLVVRVVQSVCVSVVCTTTKCIQRRSEHLSCRMYEIIYKSQNTKT